MSKVTHFVTQALAWAGVAVITTVCWILIQNIMKTL